MTVRHPVPGANVMDHLTYCIEVDQNLANELMIDTVNRLIRLLEIDLKKVERMAVCGNPIQLSIFQNMELRDLAFVGERSLKSKGVTHQKRDARIMSSEAIGIDLGGPNAEVYVPPSIAHEIGADALAMMFKTGLLDRKEPCLVTDYGTNAEMALKVGDEIYTGSAAAGPAMEGQAIHFGMLAAPGAISDIDFEGHWRCKVLDDHAHAGRRGQGRPDVRRRDRGRQHARQVQGSYRHWRDRGDRDRARYWLIKSPHITDGRRQAAPAGRGVHR